METVPQHPRFAEWESHLATFGLDPDISSYTYSQEVEQCVRAAGLLAKKNRKRIANRNGHPFERKLANAIARPKLRTASTIKNAAPESQFAPGQ